ncbi:MAG TPA: hypothetical protein VGA80_12355 [Flavobacteriaceae bacterium]|jgi:hypothetical protein
MNPAFGREKGEFEIIKETTSPLPNGKEQIQMDSPLPGISPVIQIKSKTLMLANLRIVIGRKGKSRKSVQNVQQVYYI